MAVKKLDYGHKVADADTPGGSQIECCAMSVPTILERLAWPRIGLLKVDIEGYESVLFSGIANGFIWWMQSA